MSKSQTFQPTPDQRELVRSMSSNGTPQEDIARCIGITAKTLRKHFREELDTATTIANEKVAGALFKNAMKGNVIAQLFWLKTRAGWRENAELAAAEGGPVARVVVEVQDPAAVRAARDAEANRNGGA